MATRTEFCQAMEKVYQDHGVYIGTGNGEYTEALTIGKIRQMEVNYGYDVKKTNTNIRRDLAYIGKCYEKGWSMKESRAGDCSGIIVGVMRDLGLIPKTSDYNCRTFQKACSVVDLKDLKPGDLVFDQKMTGSTSTAGHMGVYIGDGYVIESKGRDDGVVKRNVAAGPWKAGGRLDWFTDIPELTRELYYVKDGLLHGEDVKQCQQRLALKGFNPGSIDSYFGPNTEAAVIAFQEASGLNIKRYGVVGKKTWAKLWEG